eukprot:scaffold2823_cov373-Prasinococcus_capsulatus_cf.AAC.1
MRIAPRRTILLIINLAAGRGGAARSLMQGAHALEPRPRGGAAAERASHARAQPRQAAQGRGGGAGLSPSL